MERVFSACLGETVGEKWGTVLVFKGSRRRQLCFFFFLPCARKGEEGEKGSNGTTLDERETRACCIAFFFFSSPGIESHAARFGYLVPVALKFVSDVR